MHGVCVCVRTRASLQTQQLQECVYLKYVSVCVCVFVCWDADSSSAVLADVQE